MYLYNENGQHLGWFTWNDALTLSKHVDYAIYALAFSKDMPNEKLLPCQVEDTIYVGMAGGKLFDKKNRTATGGSVQTYLTKRLLSHNVQLNDARKVKEEKYKIFHETYAPTLNPEKQLFYSVSIPNKSMNITMTRSFLALCESEYIWNYCKNFNRVPLMNLSHEHKPEKRQPNSISGRVMNSPNLVGFFNYKL
jgi:hypothetical protein